METNDHLDPIIKPTKLVISVVAVWIMGIILLYLIAFCPPAVLKLLQQNDFFEVVAEIHDRMINFFSTTDFSNYATLYLIQ